MSRSKKSLNQIEKDIPTKAEKPILNQMPTFSKDRALSSYDPNFCFRVVEFLKGGKSLTAFAASIGVSPSTVRRWAEKYEDFAYAIEVANAHSQTEWEQIAIEQARGDNKGNGVTLQFIMKNMFQDNYKDKQEIEHKGGMTIMVDTGFSSIEVIEGEIKDAEVVDPDTDLL